MWYPPGERARRWPGSGTTQQEFDSVSRKKVIRKEMLVAAAVSLAPLGNAWGQTVECRDPYDSRKAGPVYTLSVVPGAVTLFSPIPVDNWIMPAGVYSAAVSNARGRLWQAFGLLVPVIEFKGEITKPYAVGGGSYRVYFMGLLDNVDVKTLLMAVHLPWQNGYKYSSYTCALR
jgi:hypothetical protein